MYLMEVELSLGTLSGSRILALWLGALLLAFAVVRLGDSIAVSQGRPVGFYVGSLFVWIVWLAWLVTWRWAGAQKAGASASRAGWVRILLAFFGVIWLGATVLEYL
jgi:hypothetical protein